MTWPVVALGEILHENSEVVVVDPTATFDMAGVSSYARGLFPKAPMSGQDTAYKVLHRIRPGQIVLSTLKGWEGAIALVPTTMEGRYLPPHNLLFDVTNSATPNYVGWLVRQPAVWNALKAASRGMGARRETVSAANFKALSVPLPPLREQSRIVARLETAAKATDRLKELQDGIRDDLAALVVRANETWATGSVRLDEAMALDEDRVTLAPDGSYPQVGIRGFGGGLFRKGGVTAADTTYRHFNRLQEGQFVVSQVKGWEGAVAVCDEVHGGLFASPEYRTFRCDPAVLRSTYLAYLCRTSWFHSKLAPATRGQGARRERLRPEMLMALSIPLPPVDVQERLERIFMRVTAVAIASSSNDLDYLLPAMLSNAFGEGARGTSTGNGIGETEPQADPRRGLDLGSPRSSTL